MPKILRIFLIIFNFIILISSPAFGDEFNIASVDLGNIKNFFHLNPLVIFLYTLMP